MYARPVNQFDGALAVCGLLRMISIAIARLAVRTAKFAGRNASDRRHGGVAALHCHSPSRKVHHVDLWQQYNELGGIQDSEVPGGSGSPPYVAALEVLDEDMPQYIHDNTEDEFTHFTFLNAYLESRGTEPVDLDAFRTLPSSEVSGA